MEKHEQEVPRDERGILDGVKDPGVLDVSRGRERNTRRQGEAQVASIFASRNYHSWETSTCLCLYGPVGHLLGTNLGPW